MPEREVEKPHLFLENSTEHEFNTALLMHVIVEIKPTIHSTILNTPSTMQYITLPGKLLVVKYVLFNIFQFKGFITSFHELTHERST